MVSRLVSKSRSLQGVVILCLVEAYRVLTPTVVLPLIFLISLGCGGKRRKQVSVFVLLRNRTLKDMTFLVGIAERGVEFWRSQPRGTGDERDLELFTHE